MSRESAWDAAEVIAGRVLQEKGVAKFPVDPMAIAQACEISVQAKPARKPGVSGMLLRVGDAFTIVYATDINSLGFQRFSVAHELGHYFLPGHVDAIFSDTGVHESRAGFRTSDRFEIEADHFAAALLMPAWLFRDALRTAGEGMVAVERLAAQCSTSLTATAIRFAQFNHDPVAVIMSSGESIDYCFMSPPLRELDGIDWIRKRDRLPVTSETRRLNADRERLQRVRRVRSNSNMQDWFGGGRSVAVVEDVVYLGAYGKTLTVLHSFELPEEEDEEAENQLVESWTPRFRR